MVDEYCILTRATPSTWNARCAMLAAAPPVLGCAVPDEVVFLQHAWRKALRRARRRRHRLLTAHHRFDRLYDGLVALVLTEEACQLLIYTRRLERDAMVCRIQRATRAYLQKMRPRSFYIRQYLRVSEVIRRRRRHGRIRLPPLYQSV